MSIIYEALKKVEKTSSAEQQIKGANARHGIKFYFLYTAVLLSGFFIAAVFFKLITPKGPAVASRLKHASYLASAGKDEQITQVPPVSDAQKAGKPQAQAPSLPFQESVPQPVPVLAPDKLLERPVPNFILSGVFFSEGGGYALINDRIVKAGDKIEGAVVVRITQNSVELKLNGAVINLSM